MEIVEGLKLAILAYVVGCGTVELATSIVTLSYFAERKPPPWNAFVMSLVFFSVPLTFIVSLAIFRFAGWLWRLGDKPLWRNG